MDKLVNFIQIIVTTFTQNIMLTGGILALLLFITLINQTLRNRLAVFGIYPRHPAGLLGIVFSPFIHGNLTHFFFNAIPLFILMNLILLNGTTDFYVISVSIILLTGILIWLFGRRALHIGASAVIMGYFGYLLAQAFFGNSALAIGLAVVLVYYFGSLLLSIFPTQERVSWEGHLFGLVAGILVNFFYPTILALFIH